jgi:hypothetical protein
MEIRTDFKDLLDLFNKDKVEYLIVGGYALAFHGAPRFTRDIDLFVRPTNENAERILGALDDFIANKRATGRLKDAADIEALGG